MDAITTEFMAMRKRHQKAVRSAEQAIDDMMRAVNEIANTIEDGDTHAETNQNNAAEAFPMHAAPSKQSEPHDPMVIDDRPQQPPHTSQGDETTQSTSKQIGDNISEQAAEKTPQARLDMLRNLNVASLSLQTALVTDHKFVGTAINKFGKVIDNVTTTNLSDLCAPSTRLETKEINDAIASHLFREGMFDVGRSFLEEANVQLADDHIRPFEQLYRILTAFRQNDLTPAIEWTREKRSFLRYTSSHLEFRLHCLAYLQILRSGECDAALEYARTHFSTFPEHITTVQKLMTCLLYAKSLPSSPYKELVHPSNRDDIERSLSREYCRAQGLAKDSLLLTVVRCGTRAIPTLLKASRVVPNFKELGIDDALPVEIDVGRDCRFHSIFTCPVSKEEASDGTNVPMILPCGHVLSKQSMMRLPRGSSRFKCPYCPMEQSISECRELQF